MGKKDLLLIGVCLAAAGVLAGSLFRRSHIPPARTFNPQRYAGLVYSKGDDRSSAVEPTALPPGETIAPVAPSEGANPNSHSASPDDLTPVIRRVNAQFEAHWREANVQPAVAADDLLIARRLSLALVGSVPSLEEIRVLQKMPSAERVDWWISHLLEDQRFGDYLAERLARSFVGVENDVFVVYRRDLLLNWLSESLRKNLPYDEMVRRMIAQRGLWTDTPEVNFISSSGDNAQKNQPDPVRLTIRTSRAFLGVRLDCVQCHNDRLNSNGWLQQDFHQLASFYGQTRLQFSGIGDNERSENKPREYKTRYLGKTEDEVVSPGVPFLKELCPSEGTRRERLAAWITHPRNKAFSRATVNRTWAMLFGRPLADPIDNLPLEGPYPPGLEILADDFTEHGFDLSRLIRVIAGTRVFQLDNLAADQTKDSPHERVWAVFPLTRLRPEQVAGALLQASSLAMIGEHSQFFSRMLFLVKRAEFVKRYGDPGAEEFQDRGGTITQQLMKFNGDLIHERTDGQSPLNAATRIAALASTDAEAVQIAYLALLTRMPGPTALAEFCKQLHGTKGAERTRAVEDIYWALLNSTEFSWNH